MKPNENMTWKELVGIYYSNTVHDDVFEDEKGYIVVGVLTFHSDKTIRDSDNYVISRNRTPCQMFNIIKNLTETKD